jgi:ATP/maltotriose-dependent transcriptional regulator MalT
VAVGLGESLLLQGRLDEADAVIERIADWAIDDDLDPQVGWRRLKATLLAQRGELEEALLLAREAVERAGASEYTDTHARTRVDLAGVLRVAGRNDEAAAELAEALRLYEQKGNLVGIAMVRSLAG